MRSLIATYTLAAGAVGFLASVLALPARAEVNPSNCGAFYELLAENLKNVSPTTKRREDRYVTNMAGAEEFFGKLAARFGKLPLRDVPRDGYTNVTITNYPRRFNLPPSESGAERTATFRFRKYGERPSGTTEGYTLTGESKGTTKVEFKIDDPDFERSKLKPGIVMNDADIALMLKDRHTFLANYEGIRERTLALPKQDRALAEKMLLTVQKLYDEAAKPGNLGEFPEGLRPQFQIEYERQAFEVKFKDHETGDTIRAQFTMDKNVKSRLPEDGTVVTQYDGALRVVEVKLPVNYLQLSREELERRAPDLAAILKMAEEIPLEDGFKKNAGKFGGLRARELRALQDGEGVSTEDLIEDLLAAGGEKMAAGSVEGSKSEAFRKLAKRPVADYFQEGHFEVRKLGETAAKVPALAPDELTKLTNDVHLYTDLMIDQLARKKARNALDPSGEEFLEVLQRLKAFQRKKTNSWAAQRIADKFSLLAVAGKRSGLTFQDLFDALVSDFLVEDGRLAPKTFAESWQNVKKKFRPQNRRRMRREMIDFIKDRAAKTYAAHILVFPATVGLGLGYANICAHYQWNCPLTTLEPAVKEDKLWKSKRKKVIEQKEALEKEIGAIEKQIEGGESAASVYGSTRKKLKDAGKKMRDRLQHMAQKNTKLKDLLVNQLSEWNTVFSTAKQELIFAQKSGDQAQITAARQEYSSALATLLNAELFMPALVTSPITDEDRSLKNIDDAATFQKKTLELLKAYQESIDKIIQQMDGTAPAATQP